jgi:calcineurin-like phosphoesterase
MGYFLDGRFSCVWGTHTHVQTADGHVLPNGTGYITDLGMTGSLESCIGMDYRQAVKRFRGHLVGALQPSDLDPGMQGALFTLDDTGKCQSVEAISVR